MLRRTALRRYRTTSALCGRFSDHCCGRARCTIRSAGRLVVRCMLIVTTPKQARRLAGMLPMRVRCPRGAGVE